MIERLLIKDSVAFKEVCITPSPAFNIFSGVSGSGKSVLMESILALFGLRESNASLIEASLSEQSLKNLALPENIECDGELVLSIVKKEKTKYFLNSQSFSKRRTRELFGDFVKYISAHSTNELNEKNLLSVLDLLIDKADFRDLLSAFAADFKDLQEKIAALENLENEERNIAQLRDFAAFEIAQIESVNPKIGEYEELLEVKKMLSKKERLLEKIAAIKPCIEGFSGVLGFLENIDKSKEIYAEILREIEVLVNDEEERLENITQDDIEAILNRIESLSNLAHKYGSIEATLAHLAQKKRDLEHYNNISFNKSELQKALSKLQNRAQERAESISKYRQNALEHFNAKIAKFCAKLKLNKPKATLHRVQMSASGIDRIEIALKDSTIATLSSGEFNRLKLAIMCVEVEFSMGCGILILDEIDANLSGSESEGVAEILAFLAKKYQIFAISHQSHMPSFANHHYLIAKTPTKSTIALLDKEGRIAEIARMISGANITDKALNFAREKLAHLK